MDNTNPFIYFGIGFFVAWVLFGGRKHGSHHLIIKKLNQIMATQAEHAQQLRDITAQNEKARQEILAKIANLETALANAGNTSPEVDAAMAELKASVQTDDDLNPDAPGGEENPPA